MHICAYKVIRNLYLSYAQSLYGHSREKSVLTYMRIQYGYMDIHVRNLHLSYRRIRLYGYSHEKSVLIVYIREGYMHIHVRNLYLS